MMKTTMSIDNDRCKDEEIDNRWPTTFHLAPRGSLGRSASQSMLNRSVHRSSASPRRPSRSGLVVVLWYSDVGGRRARQLVLVMTPTPTIDWPAQVMFTASTSATHGWVLFCTASHCLWVCLSVPWLYGHVFRWCHHIANWFELLNLCSVCNTGGGSLAVPRTADFYQRPVTIGRKVLFYSVSRLWVCGSIRWSVNPPIWSICFK